MISFYRRSLWTLALLGSSLSLPAHAEPRELETVPYVDVARYLGKWYEIARLPQSTQAGCTAVTAEYSLNEDGSVKVLNSCRLFNPSEGRLITISGKATPVDASNSKLEVSFFDGLQKGNYWVLELAEDYSYALVGEPSRSSLFVLSRSPQLAEEVYQKLLTFATDKHGYDVSPVEKTPQVLP